MDLQLHELGLTLLVGAFGVLTIEAISYFTFDRRLTGFFAGKWGLHQEHARPVKEDPMTLGVVIVLCFCLGLVAEDFCYDFDDVSTQWLYRIPFINLIGRYVVHDLRKEQSDITHVTLLTTTIVRNLEAGEPRKTDSPNVTPLGYSLLSVRPFSLLDGERGIDVERWLASIHPDESMDYSPIDGRRVPPYPSHSKSPPLPSRWPRSLSPSPLPRNSGRGWGPPPVNNQPTSPLAQPPAPSPQPPFLGPGESWPSG